MILAYKKTLGKFTKVLGFEKTPPPFGKKSQKIPIFFWGERPLLWLWWSELMCLRQADKHSQRGGNILDQCLYSIAILSREEVAWLRLRCRSSTELSCRMTCIFIWFTIWSLFLTSLVSLNIFLLSEEVARFLLQQSLSCWRISILVAEGPVWSIFHKNLSSYFCSIS